MDIESLGDRLSEVRVIYEKHFHEKTARHAAYTSEGRVLAVAEPVDASGARSS